MKFYTDDTAANYVTLNTLDELKAYALGGTGKITIDYRFVNYETGELYRCPVITKEEA